MNRKTLKQLYSLNKNFYSNTNKYFSNSRDYFWSGWDKCLKYIQSKDSLLDVGCGNGRFAGFLEKHIQNFNYMGIDNSKELLQIARETYPQYEFQLLDLQERMSNLLDEKFDVITLFGVLHHIPSRAERERIFKKLTNILKPRGFLIVTVWRFTQFSRFQKKTIEPKEVGIDKEQLEKNDYLLDWKRGTKAIRYCHYTDKKEMRELAQNANLEIEDTFLGDGKNGETNRYWVLDRQ
jgi:2-polyprenyl-3-methyl-5-hydroxy-6-metoxy-1,4-benzoquinol methylase